ncbi:kinase family protein [Tripterygium wilfordii]|uniref:Kinase family protein n=1 Tax=Tripterygium wilfordii TaxID=458696 RepID=A0A7J7DVQ6_TRIWF|nr:kinase family protein [Tripterygium wilfordii]
MKCFSFYNGEKKDEQKTTNTKSVLVQSQNSTYACGEIGRNGSDLNVQNFSATSTESMGHPSFLSMSQRPSYLRVFTVSELKSATRNFSRSAMIGQGGFGCVYKGLINSVLRNQPKSLRLL